MFSMFSRLRSIFDDGPKPPVCNRCGSAETFRTWDFFVCSHCGDYWPVRPTVITVSDSCGAVVRNPGLTDTTEGGK